METVNVLLSTYNGERYLIPQLESLYAQRNVKVRLQVRDDGSTDGTVEILRREARAGRLRWTAGENLGPARSFLELMRTSEPGTWYAFCDQDDYWLPGKLERALGRLSGADGAVPALYYGVPTLADASLRPLPPSPRASEQMTTLGGALIAGNATGCTMVFNRALLEAVAGRTPACLLMHDDWVHKVCLLRGGALVFDEHVPMLYRQHGGNCVGTPASEAEALRRHLRGLLSGERARSRTAASLLECYGEVMTPDQRDMTQRAARYRTDLRSEIALLSDRRIRTPYWRRNLLFLAAVVLKAY